MCNTARDIIRNFSAVVSEDPVNIKSPRYKKLFHNKKNPIKDIVPLGADYWWSLHGHRRHQRVTSAHRSSGVSFRRQDTCC